MGLGSGSSSSNGRGPTNHLPLQQSSRWLMKAKMCFIYQPHTKNSLVSSSESIPIPCVFCESRGLRRWFKGSFALSPHRPAALPPFIPHSKKAAAAKWADFRLNAHGEGSLQGPAASLLAPHHRPGKMQHSHPMSMGPGACHRGAGHSFQKTPEVTVPKSLREGQEGQADRGSSAHRPGGGQGSAAETRG